MTNKQIDEIFSHVKRYGFATLEAPSIQCTGYDAQKDSDRDTLFVLHYTADLLAADVKLFIRTDGPVVMAIIVLGVQLFDRNKPTGMWNPIESWSPGTGSKATVPRRLRDAITNDLRDQWGIYTLGYTGYLNQKITAKDHRVPVHTGSLTSQIQ